MRKFTLFLVSLFLTVGAMAQIQPSTKIDAPENLYKIKSKRGIYMAAHANPTQENYGRFAFYAVEGKENTYKIYSYDANLWLTYTKATGYSNGMNFVSFASTQDAANEWYVAKPGDYYQVAPYNTAGVAGKYWNFFGGIAGTYYSYDDYRNTLGLYEKGAAADDGSAWVFEAVDVNDYAAPVTLNYEVTDGEGNVYTGTCTGVADRTGFFTHNALCPITDITFEGNTYKANIAIPFSTSGVVISSFNGNEIRFAVKEGKEIATKTVPTAETINNYLWNIHPSFANSTLTFSIEHVATGKFLYTTATSHAHNDGTITLEDEGTQFVYVANNGFKYGNLWLSTNSSNSSEQCLGMWNSQHNGAKHLIHKVNNYTITDAAGNVYEGEFNGYDLKNKAFLPAFTGDANYSLSGDAWNGYDYNGKINFSFPVSKEGEAPNAMLLGIWDNNKIWHAIDNDIKIQTVAVNPVDLSCMWAIYPTIENHAISFAIKNVAADKYVYSNADNNASILNTKGTIVLSETASKFEVVNNGTNKAFKFAGKDKLYISINSTNDTDVYLGVHRGLHGGTNLATPVLNTFNVTVGEAGYATLYTPWEVNVPATSDIKAHTVTVDGEYAKLSDEPLTTIPAGTGVVLKGTGTLSCTISNTSADAIEGNLLAGTAMKSVITRESGEYYILAKPQDDEIGFYKAVNGEDKNTFINGAYKAYLHVANANGAAQYSFRFEDGTTGINEVKTENGEVKAIYDLTGRRVEAITAPGIYIVNGKKVLVK